jgi:hypothetical protein
LVVNSGQETIMLRFVVNVTMDPGLACFRFVQHMAKENDPVQSTTRTSRLGSEERNARNGAE